MSSGNPVPPTGDKRNFIGIELEWYHLAYPDLPGVSRDRTRKPEWARTDFIEKNITLQFEGVGPGGDTCGGYESTILATEATVEAQLRLMIDSIAKNGGQVDRSCGFHVHIDLRNRAAHLSENNDRGHFTCYSPRWAAARNHFEKFTSELRTKYANQPRPGMGSSYSDRGKHTLEVRLLHGTLDVELAVAYTKRLLEIANMPEWQMDPDAKVVVATSAPKKSLFKSRSATRVLTTA